MATVPYFGNPPAVTELDVGQPGGALHPTYAKFVCRVIEQEEEVNDVINAIPQQNIVFMDMLGYTGQRVLWTGGLYTTTAAYMEQVANNIRRARSGQTRTDGVRSAVDISETTPATLKDANSPQITLSTRARLVGCIWGRQHALAAGGYGFYRQLTLTFRIIA